MRFFHLSDLHIGKQLHRYNLKEDQEYVLGQILDRARELRPDAVVIAGDVYDKTVPSAEAVSVFNRFLTELSDIGPSILMIAGNHDSADRLEYAASILDRQHIYIVGNPPAKPEDHIRKVTLQDVYGEVDFYLLPFLKPGYVRGVFEKEADQTLPEAVNAESANTESANTKSAGSESGAYQEAVQKLLEREQIDRTRRNVLVTHQFYTAGKELTKTCDSETFSVGGIDNVDVGILEPFDYVAMGHIHSPQRVGKDHFRYCGTPLKYSVSECDQEKVLSVVSLGKPDADGCAEVKVEYVPLVPLRDVRKLRGTLHEILEKAGNTPCHDYVSITLTDDVDPYRPKEQLENLYTHILEIRMDNERTRRMLAETEEEVTLSDPLSVFQNFYREVQGRDLSEEETEIMRAVLEEVEE